MTFRLIRTERLPYKLSLLYMDSLTNLWLYECGECWQKLYVNGIERKGLIGIFMEGVLA